VVDAQDRSEQQARAAAAVPDAARASAERVQGDSDPRTWPAPPQVQRLAGQSRGEALPSGLQGGVADAGLRVHHDAAAAGAAALLGARAFVEGRDLYFGAGQYQPWHPEGQRLLAHELHHARQPGPPGLVHRSAVPGQESMPAMPEAALSASGSGAVESAALPATGPDPETCDKPPEVPCDAASDTPGGVTHEIVFPVDSSVLNPLQLAELDAAAAAWHATGASAPVRVDGYASPDGSCAGNWELSCRRAMAVAAALEHPSDGSPGVDVALLDRYAHGEDNSAGSALSANRRATVSMPEMPGPDPKPDPDPGPEPPSYSCLPMQLGHARGCGGSRATGSGGDLSSHDFPSISWGSALKLDAWARAHPPLGMRSRSLITDTECEAEMAAVLGGAAGGAGLAALRHFTGGSGSTFSHGNSSTLGGLALASPTFTATLATVQADLEAQLAAQAAAGALDPCTLAITPPATHFPMADGATLYAVIGGTQGEELWLNGFAGDAGTRRYQADLQFLICDHFGVDESDLYAPGLMGFWVLQHERAGYTAYINELDLSVSVSGTF
jgi:outer membrane protein OmpA-like peptidoglycan-associated protein